ncbi:MAG: cytochrome c oxidase subunit II [Halobacteriota archaeon]
MRWVTNQLAQAADYAGPLQHLPGDGGPSRVSVFGDIYLVFLVLGTAVGVVVIGYMLYNGWKYRASANGELDDPPVLGELPTGEGGGKKLFVSFGISAIIVISLIIWSYSAVIYVEEVPQQAAEDNMVVEVEGYTFAWDFTYENGNTTTNTLVVPEDQVVTLEVTSRDVWHTFGSHQLRVKADAIPGQTSTTWFVAEERGIYRAECFELCGAGHSHMVAEIIVVSQEEYDAMYEEFTETGEFPEPPDDLEEH